MDIDTILLEAEEHMEKGLNYLKNELRGVRTGRASPALVEFVKVDYYGSPTDLRSIALVTTPEPIRAAFTRAMISAVGSFNAPPITSGTAIMPPSAASKC